MKKINPGAKLLVIIYLAFISLGVPDGILGVAWPNMRIELSLPLEMMSILTTSLLCFSAFSSVMSGSLQKTIGASKITFVSCLMTGIALMGYAVSKNIYFLVLFTIPLGLGQGAVDSVLNNYVAEHYTSKHMNWLHCFWGVGASIGPVTMTFLISYIGTWRAGYKAISGFQLFLSIILILSIKKRIWNISDRNVDNHKIGKENDRNKLSGAMEQGCAILQFFVYTGIEFSMSVWISSVLVEDKGLALPLAGLIASAYYMAIMLGRFISGFLVNRLGNMKLLRIGLTTAIIGSSFLCVVPDGFGLNLVGITIFGLGLAPLYPCLMHETPNRFGKNVSKKLIGYQVGASCLGGSLVSTGIGLVLAGYSLKALFPILMLLLLFYCMLNEYLHRKLKRT